VPEVPEVVLTLTVGDVVSNTNSRVDETVDGLRARSNAAAAAVFTNTLPSAVGITCQDSIHPSINLSIHPSGEVL